MGSKNHFYAALPILELAQRDHPYKGLIKQKKNWTNIHQISFAKYGEENRLGLPCQKKDLTICYNDIVNLLVVVCKELLTQSVMGAPIDYASVTNYDETFASGKIKREN